MLRGLHKWVIKRCLLSGGPFEEIPAGPGEKLFGCMGRDIKSGPTFLFIIYRELHWGINKVSRDILLFLMDLNQRSQIQLLQGSRKKEKWAGWKMINSNYFTALGDT